MLFYWTVGFEEMLDLISLSGRISPIDDWSGCNYHIHDCGAGSNRSIASLQLLHS